MKECIILAGGYGTRLQTVVKDVPKCMAEVAGKPFLYYLFKYLINQEVDHIILSLGYKHEIITKWLKNNRFGIDISYVIETEPLGTGGAIKFATQKAKNETVSIVNGDTFFPVNLAELEAFHLKKNADISIALKPMENFDRYGSVELDGSDRILKFNEKKHCESGLINGGIYVINKKIFELHNLPDKFSFEKDILENKEMKLNVFGYPSDSYFIDIGIPEDYAKANIDFLKF
ncbi:MAG: nucleotidyltransferase family protein [Dysgonomonas sp.]